MSLEFINLFQPDSAQMKAELTAGLLARQPHIAPKYFYDPMGSRLFEAITALTEYYPTRTEALILSQHGPDIARLAGESCTLIDLGAGNCAKAQTLMPLLRPRQYVAIDVSSEFVRSALEALALNHPDMELLGIGMDFSSQLNLPDPVAAEHRLVFYPGSSIGNFTPVDAARLLSQIAQVVGEKGSLLIGVDLRKDKSTLEAAYDDAIGVTAAFNKNLLLNVNRWLGADFDPRLWRHLAFFNEQESRIEMHLEATQVQTVRWLGGQRTFAKGQRIHTENSYKYAIDKFSSMLHNAGFVRTEFFSDEAQAFGVWLAFR